MNQCVPSWDVDDHSAAPPRLPLRPQSNCNSFATDVPTLDYEVAELTWENGQLAMHGLGPPRVSTKVATAASPTKYTWDKPRAGGTLESIINQATLNPQQKAGSGSGEDLAPWFDHYNLPGNGPGSGSANMTMDALVPSSKARNQQEKNSHALQGMRPRTVGCSTRVGSCSGAGTVDGARVARVGMGAAHEGSSMADQSVGASATFGRDSQQVSLDTCERELGVGAFTSTSMDNTSSGKQCTKTTTGDDHDSVSHSRPQRVPDGKEEKKKGSGKSSVSTKRSRAAAIHNQSERKRRDKINQRMKTLQKLVPNSSKTDKASMLDEVIEYLKQLQAQVQMMSRMNMSPMMLPMAMQQQLQMSMMASMGMGMGMGMAGMGVMDMNTIGRPNVSGMPPVFHPTALMPMASWDGTGDRMATPSSVMPDPLSTYLACHSQPMTMDAYSRMAALYHQFQQAPAPTSKN